MPRKLSDNDIVMPTGGLKRRTFLKGSALAAFLYSSGGLLAACTPQAGTTASPSGQTKVKGGTVVEGAPVDIQMLNPILGSDNYGFSLAGVIFDGLLSSDTAGNLIPVLAQGLPTVSSDNLSLTFKLRPNVKWTDGQDLNSDDVVFTFELFHDPKYKDVTTSRRAEFEQYVDTITAPDPLTVVFKLKSPYPPILSSSLQRGILPKHVLGNLAAKDINTASFNSAPTVSSGAFKFGRWDKGQQVVLERNDKYWGGSVPLDRYILKIIPESSAMVSALRNGEIDLVLGVDPALGDQVKSAPNLTLADYWASAVVFMSFQLDPAKPASKIFSDKAVRQALLYALDRDTMATAIYRGAAATANSMLPSISWAYSPNVSPKYTFDKTKAEKLLDDAGWKRGASGTREKNGTQLSFELMSVSGMKPLESTVASMQDQWKAIGVTATIKLVDFAALIQQVRNDRKFDATVWSINLSQDPDIISLLVTTPNAATGGFNSATYKNPQIDKMLGDAAKSFDQEARKKNYIDVQNVLMEELPYAPIFETKELLGINKRVQGVVGVVGPFNRYFRNYTKDISVSDGK